jgi:hypothetical protein
MMNQLLWNTEAAMKSLVERVKKYSIRKVQGEEVINVTSHIAHAINHLKHIGKLPQDMSTTFLTIMQTRSVSEFNKVFAAIEVQKTLYNLNQSLSMYVNSFTYTDGYIISVAEAQCLKLFENGQRIGATTRGQDSTFSAQQWLNPNSRSVTIVASLDVVLTSARLQKMTCESKRIESNSWMQRRKARVEAEAEMRDLV